MHVSGAPQEETREMKFNLCAPPNNSQHPLPLWTHCSWDTTTHARTHAEMNTDRELLLGVLGYART